MKNGSEEEYCKHEVEEEEARRIKRMQTGSMKRLK